MPSALNRIEAIMEMLDHRSPVVFLDYDGVLTPVVQRPDDAVMDEAARRLVRDLARNVPVAVISGRDLEDLKSRLRVDGVHYAGSHGFDIVGAGDDPISHAPASAFLSTLETAEAGLKREIHGIDGARLERKKYTIAVHYREAPDANVGKVAEAVETVRRAHDGLRKTRGKKVFELQPDLDWDKGKAVRWLLENAIDLEGKKALPIYIGDDVTDEDAFRELADHGIGIFVRDGDDAGKTLARYSLDDVEAVHRFLKQFLQRILQKYGVKSLYHSLF